MSPDKRQSIRGIFAHAVAGRWSEALEESRVLATGFPDDTRLRALAEDLALRSAEPSSQVLTAPAPAAESAREPASPRLQGPAPAPLHVFPPLVAPSPTPLPQPVAASGASAPDSARTGETALDKAFLEEARRRLERQGSGSSLGEVVQDSRRISDVLREATTRRRDEDSGGLIEAARACLAQDLLPEAMRLCQTLLASDPNNEQVKGLLREISRRRGL